MGMSNTIHVSGFPRDTRARDMAADFESIGKVVRIDIPPMRPFQDRPYAFVQYETHEDCERAVEALSGRTFSLDTRFKYHVQLARSRPYATKVPGPAGRTAGRPYTEFRDTRGGMLSGYRGRNHRELDPRDFRGVGRGLSGGYRTDSRVHKFREPRQYRDREPPKAYESISPYLHDVAHPLSPDGYVPQSLTTADSPAKSFDSSVKEETQSSKPSYADRNGSHSDTPQTQQPEGSPAQPHTDENKGSHELMAHGAHGASHGVDNSNLADSADKSPGSGENPSAASQALGDLSSHTDNNLP
ncbi:HBL331Wp [Eremothecium sinecaudum]|uniref:HBL331Wp n=1 Tax=Eremothecium sinecaudum TaxID=45286 RepID=A0A120K0R1_9SACH|nr:HBL331Wp [Eremothecium sinecaudum]AMD18571.1 HBL331Wp [Eremothecium sinecaudum]